MNTKTMEQFNVLNVADLRLLRRCHRGGIMLRGGVRI